MYTNLCLTVLVHVILLRFPLIYVVIGTFSSYKLIKVEAKEMQLADPVVLILFFSYSLLKIIITFKNSYNNSVLKAFKIYINKHSSYFPSILPQKGLAKSNIVSVIMRIIIVLEHQAKLRKWCQLIKYFLPN